MRRVLLALILAAALAPLPASSESSAPDAPKDDLAARLDAALNVRALRGARVGALVIDGERGQALLLHSLECAYQ